MGVGEGLKAIACSLSSAGSNQVLTLLQEAKTARTNDQTTLQDMKTFLETGNQVQLAILEELKKIAQK